MDACANAGLRVVLPLMEVQKESDTVTYNILINVCSIDGEWQLAIHFLFEMREDQSPDVISFNSAISACEKTGQWECAVALLSCMLNDSIEPNHITLSSVLSASVGRWDVALSLYSSLTQTNLVPNAIACNALLATFEAGGRWCWVLSLFEDMAQLEQVDAITYSLALTACLKAMQWQRVLEILPKGGEALDVYSCKAAIGACAIGAQAMFAMPLLEKVSFLGCVMLQTCAKEAHPQLLLFGRVT